ncbi:MAG: hypothetical protein SOZ02_09195, partial [Hallerella porci]|uniref:hypothetical protein n=1 Tax=Hallerella porci TaxID=1945871 RepID=UPI002A7F0847
MSAKVSNYDKIIRAENAKTRKEQVEISSQLFGNVKDDVLDKLTIASLKTLNKELPRAYNDIGITSVRNLSSFNTGAVAGYKNDVFYIDPSSFNSKMQNPKQFFKENVSDIQRRKKLRHLAIDFASNVKRHLIDH